MGPRSSGRRCAVTGTRAERRQAGADATTAEESGGAPAQHLQVPSLPPGAHDEEESPRRLRLRLRPGREPEQRRADVHGRVQGDAGDGPAATTAGPAPARFPHHGGAGGGLAAGELEGGEELLAGGGGQREGRRSSAEPMAWKRRAARRAAASNDRRCHPGGAERGAQS